MLEDESGNSYSLARLPATMRAARLHGIGDLRLEDVPRPEPSAGQVLLQVICVGVCGSDAHYYREGRIGNQVIDEPLILGHEFSARVVGLGEGATGIGLGQLVAVEPAVSCGDCEWCNQGHPNLCPKVRFCGCPPYDGVLAEYVALPAENCYPLPAGVDPVEAVMLEPLGIAIHAVDLAHLRPGQTVVVLGAGPIGLLIAAVARASGAAQVLMSEPLADRRGFAEGYCADVVLDPGRVDIGSEVLRLTGGRGVDVVFEAAGAPDTCQQAADSVCIGGKVIVAGIPEDDRMLLTASVIRRKGLTIKLVRRMKHTYPRAIRMVQKGMVEVRSVARPVLPLDQVRTAYEMVARYEPGVLRAIIQIQQP